MIFINPMELSDFVEIIDGTFNDYVVRIAYKFQPEEPYEVSNELLLYDFKMDDHCWENDWYEGQEYVMVLGYIDVQDVTF